MSDQIPLEDIIIGTAAPFPAGNVDVTMSPKESIIRYKDKSYTLETVHWTRGPSDDTYWCRVKFSTHDRCTWTVAYYPTKKVVNFYFTHVPNPREDWKDVYPFGDLHEQDGLYTISNLSDHKIFPHTFTFQFKTE